jgi:hypothetical protein
MYITTRNVAGDTLMTCSSCGHAIRMNKICETPLQSATDMLKHMAAHNAARAFAAAAFVSRPEPEPVPALIASIPPLAELQWIAPGPQLPN